MHRRGDARLALPLLDTGVLAAGMALVAVSFAGWYGITWAVGDAGGFHTDSSSANAWEASTVWAGAVALGGLSALG